MRLLIISFIFSNILIAQVLNVGDRYPSAMITNQFQESSKVYNSDKFIIMTFEKDVSGSLNAYLKKRPSNYLSSRDIKFIADISGMPTIITHIFALPKMKKYHYSIYLIDKEDEAEKFVRKDGLITLYEIENRVIKSISYMTPKELIHKLDSGSSPE
ncbi:MAG: hypothetical protein U9N33_00425 [Campylobacterota bacterium]|nr:hypothetical protein [Campylobacterota bacterium]